MNLYLYAIVDRIPAAWRPPATGLGDGSVVPRRVHDVVVLGSLLDAVPPATPRTLAVHQDIVATLIEAAALVPFRYGSSVPAAALGDWLAARRAAVTAALDGVRGRVEMSVKLLRLDHAVDAQLGGRRRAEEAPPAGPGAGELAALAETLVERAGVAEWQYRPSGSVGNVAASIAFLVDRADLAGFLARIAPVASHATGVAVVPTGPWPAYSFVPDLARPPLTRATAEGRPGGEGRRAG